MAVRVSTVAAAGRPPVLRDVRGRDELPDGSSGPEGVDPSLPLLSPDREHPAWVDARPFRAHLRHLMAVGLLDPAEVAVVLGLSTRAVTVLLDGRGGRATRRISRQTARRLLRVTDADVRGLRWCLTPAEPARHALGRLRSAGWSDDEVALAVGFGVPDLDGLADVSRCNRLLGVRLVGLARTMPTTLDDQDLVPLARAA